MTLFIFYTGKICLGYEYWVPYVDNVQGPSTGFSGIMMYTISDSSLVELDFNHDGIVDDSIVITSSQIGSVSSFTSQLCTGTVLYCDDLISVYYNHCFADWGVYEDSFTQYEIFPTEYLGNDYFITGPAMLVSLLACNDATEIDFDFNFDGAIDDSLVLNQGESHYIYDLQNAIHAVSNLDFMVVCYNHSVDHYDSTFAYLVPPYELLHNQYFIPDEHPYNYNNSVSYSRIHILSTSNNNNVSINGNSYTLGFGDTLTYYTNEETTIQSSFPICCVYLSDIGANDPWTFNWRHYIYAYHLMNLSELNPNNCYSLFGFGDNPHGYPHFRYTLSSYSNNNSIQLDLFGDGIVDSTLVLNSGITSYLDELSFELWDTNNLKVISDNPLQIIFSFRGWWESISEGAAARIVPPIFGGETGVVSKSTSDMSLEFILFPTPNPFNPSTSLSYSLPASGEIALTIYDIQGREVAALFEGYQAAGNHQAVFDGSQFASGIYFAVLQSGEFRQAQKLALIK